MSSNDSRRSKRRRNKRGGGKANSRPVSSNGNAINVSSAPSAKTDGQMMSSMPASNTLSELDLDNIPQPLSQMPRSHNPYLDRDHCVLCHQERPDLPGNRIPLGSGDEKENNRQPHSTHMPLWLCPNCQRTVQQGDAGTKSFDPSTLGELLLPPTLPLYPGLQNFDVTFSTSPGAGDSVSSVVTSKVGSGAGSGGGVGGGGSAVAGGIGDGPCQCEPCRERREIAAEQEHSRQQLGECWTELSHLVRCVYWEAGTSLTGEESTTKLSLPRMKELVHRLCAHDPHLLYLCLEAEVEDFIKEMRERLLKQLEGGFRTPPLAKQFITMLLEEYAALCSAAQTLLAILEELEKEHLHKFNLTWPLHNKHLFHSLIYMEPGLHDNLGTLIKQLRAVANQKEPYLEESYASLLQRYLQFDNDMSVVGVVWRDCQQLIEDYTDEQELYKGKDALNRSWDVGVSSSKSCPLFSDASKAANSRSMFHSHSALIGHMGNGGSPHDATMNHKGSTKKKCLCDDCSLNRITSSLFTPDLYEEIGLKRLTEAAPGGQLSTLDTFFQSINPPDLSSTTSSECSSQEDSEEVIPIFSRNDLISSGFCSPRSEDSDDSDDLDSESSPSPSHENAFEEEEDDEDGERRHGQNQSRGRGRPDCRAASPGQVGERQTGGGDLKKDSYISNSRPCECHACTANLSSHLPATTTMTANIGDKNTLPNKPSYLFYPNLPNHQPLDLSHHGITAKHPLIHPHLYNMASQKPTKIPNHSQQAFQLNLDTTDGLQAYSDWNSAYESAKMVLHSHSHSHAHYSHEDAPDLVQSVKATLQSKQASVHQAHHEAESKATKEEKGRKHGHDSSGVMGSISSLPLSEWTKQHRLPHGQQLHNDGIGKGKILGQAQELCAKHNLPTVPKIPNNNRFFPPLLQEADAIAAGSLTSEALAQQFSQGVLTQQGLVTPNMLAAPGAGLQLQNAGIHMADVHHLQQQQQQAPSGGKKKKSPSGEEALPAEPVIRVPDYLSEQQLQPCSHHNPISHSSSILGSGAGLCNSSMQTANSTPTSASVCSSEPDYETPNYTQEEDIHDDKDSNASSTTRERESKHCECCYCEFFGQGPQPAPTSRNYTEIRDRLRLRLRERKQPKDHSPSHEPVRPPPATELLQNDDRTVEDLLSFIEGAKKSKSNSKAAKRQRQRQRKAEEKAKHVPDNGHKNPVHVPVSLHHHHHHHHHHHVEVTREKQLDAVRHNTNCKLQQQQQQQQTEAPSPLPQHQAAKQAAPHQPVVASLHQPTASSSTTPTTSSALPRPSAASSKTKPAPSAPSLESQGKAKTDNSKKKVKGTGLTAPQSSSDAGTPSNAGTRNLESKSKGKQNGAGKQGPSLVQAVDLSMAVDRAKEEQERIQNQECIKSQVRRERSNGTKQVGQQEPPKPLAQPQQQKQQQAQREKGDKSTKVEESSAWKTVAAQEKRLNGSAGDNHRSNVVSTKNSNGKNKQNGIGVARSDDPQQRKANAVKSLQGQGSQNGTNMHNHKTGHATVAKRASTGSLSNTTREQVQQKGDAIQAKSAGKKLENNHHTKLDVQPSQNGSSQEPLTNGTAVSNGNGTTSKRRKKKKNSSDNPNASIDEIFLPKENVDMNEMDETERELEAFKRFCLASTPQQHKEKVVFNVKDLALKKSSLQAH
ncbi:uncharacterized protein [Diadema antillarum]|uniref:uncharacterized protein n=1 Tax=Diadema antillarum TaxID=105358 RepID=UPI003A8359E4